MDTHRIRSYFNIGIVMAVNVSICSLVWSQSIITKIDDLSQFTPKYIYRAEQSNLLFLYTLDGLNVSNGLHTRTYKKSTHNLLDNEISGRFFEDLHGNVWFTTSRCLNKYSLRADDFENVKVANKDGVEINSGYKVIGEWDSVSILLQVGGELVIYDVEQRLVTRRIDISLDLYSTVAFDRRGDILYVVVGNTNETTLYYVEKSNQKTSMKIAIDASSIKFIDDQLFIGTTTGELVVYDSSNGELIDKTDFGNERVFDVAKIDEEYLITTDNAVFLIDPNDFNKRKELELLDLDGIKLSSGFLIPSVDTDSILWVGVTGKGVYAFSLVAPQIRHWPITTEPSQSVRATRILEDDRGQYFIFSFTEELYLLDSLGGLVNKWDQKELLDERVHADWWQGKLLFEYKTSLRVFDPVVETMDTIQANGHDIVQTRVHNQKVYFTTSQSHVLRLNDDFKLDTIAKVDANFSNVELRYFAFDNENRLYTSNADISLIIFDAVQFEQLAELPISGGLLSLTDIGPDVLITNREGLFIISKSDFTTKQVLDAKGNLSQQIYGLLIDDNGYYWMSSNNGIYRYDPKTNNAYQFDIRDGLQATEFNRMSYLKDSKGRFLFGGVNGINVFDPLKVKLSDKQAPIDFYNYKINDEDSREFGVGNYVETFDLYHDNNTITFEFVGIDYTGPEHVNLKYFMEGYDQDWVELEENNGVARYANLPYGDYTFHMLASNSDEVWADEAKTVNVSVHAPFWATWWFQSIAGLFLLWTGYSIVRSYYRRKIERRDFVLKQQALQIEKQEAVEYERNRIASEMHDDLGSGLTTIKYLSEHAMNSAVSNQEKGKIERIAEHANTLVRNMSEIIWAMNSRYDTATDLVGYIRRYASEYLEEHQKTLKFSSEGISHKLEISGEKRRNLFLVTKEILHNFIKYADTSEIRIDIFIKDESLHLQFLEVGNEGFNVEGSVQKGNGLFNMNKRMEQIGGMLVQMKVEDGYSTVISYPVTDG